MPARSASAKPVRKVAAAGTGGALATLIIWVLTQLLHVDVTPEVAAAITTIVAFIFGYATPPGANEVVATP